MHLETSHQPYILRREIAHQHTADGPVHHVHATHIARADGQVVTLVGTGAVEPWQVVGVVAEVGVHLEDVAIVALQRPFKSCYIGRAQSLFPASLDDKQPVGKLGVHQPVHNLRRAVGRSVVNHEYVETLLEGEHRTNNLLDVLFLVVGRNDYNAVACAHSYWECFR